MKRFILVTICILLTGSNAMAQWQSKKDNKPVAELELMEQHELASTAIQPCSNRINRTEALDYLSTIGRVATKKNGGKDPEWLTQMFTATAKNPPSGCLEAWQGVYDKYMDGLRKKYLKN